MKHIELTIKDGSKTHTLSGEIKYDKVTNIKYDGEIVETADQRKARLKMETQIENYEKLLLHQYRVSKEVK